MTGRVVQEKDERTAWERLHDAVADAAPNLGRFYRQARPIGFAERVFALAAQRDLAEAYEDAQEQASEVALAGNPRRADYIEHMARRLIG
jgi:hypothetical protein